MELVQFRVTNFRSVEDSGWITVNRVCAFIGVNESGKTNLLVPLWKLNPAREGEIQPTSDYPKKFFGTIREKPEKYKFISALFNTGHLAEEISSIVGEDITRLEKVIVSRYFDGNYVVNFPDCDPPELVSSADVESQLHSGLTDIEGSQARQKEEVDRERICQSIKSIIAELPANGCSKEDLSQIISTLKSSLPTEPAKTSIIVPRFSYLINAMEEFFDTLAKENPGYNEKVRDLIKNSLPKFVYYSNYGNLDSEIYLPHVVHNLNRTDLGSKEAAKARTLRVLFKFVRLSPTEILELGQDFRDPNNPAREPTPDEVAKIGEKKRERSILLQSASTLLTGRFRDWWKQGDYRFRFEADGNHFRIWVADDRRPEEIELESRSTGLQWFLSFYLVFLVESDDQHQNSILLLDEPGLSLHPLAQRDLSDFFEGLSETNQILYTTHSPFLVDADHLDRARKVYVAPDGTTKATENLREGAEGPGQSGAAYAVHSALNLTVAESLLLGCQPIIVEGASDQHYLTTIKTLLIRSGKTLPKRELVFPPSGGTKTARMVASILTGRDESLPLVLLDGDTMGRKMAAELRSSLYQGHENQILDVKEFVDIEDAEIEDLFPSSFTANIVDRWQRVADPDHEFAIFLQEEKPLVPQIEAWAAKQNLKLDKGWKVDLAKRVKQAALTRGVDIFDSKIQAKWIELFKRFNS